MTSLYEKLLKEMNKYDGVGVEYFMKFVVFQNLKLSVTTLKLIDDNTGLP